MRFFWSPAKTNENKMREMREMSQKSDINENLLPTYEELREEEEGKPVTSQKVRQLKTFESKYIIDIQDEYEYLFGVLKSNIKEKLTVSMKKNDSYVTFRGEGEYSIACKRIWTMLRKPTVLQEIKEKFRNDGMDFDCDYGIEGDSHTHWWWSITYPN